MYACRATLPEGSFQDGLLEAVVEDGFCQLRAKTLYDIEGQSLKSTAVFYTKPPESELGFAVLCRVDALPACRRYRAHTAHSTALRVRPPLKDPKHDRLYH